MGKKVPKLTSDLSSTLGGFDFFALSFGAMIGLGWIAVSGDWIRSAGGIGATVAFAVGGVIVVVTGLLYAELSTTFPKAGGELQYSLHGIGPRWGFVAAWAVLLGYIGVTAL